ncbi:hypothetical protein NM208_g17088 [Fusarium decemcellulare]|uniref:Uncharacterized protein n=1 Tax=Fusarium decemcellulare TaxID=57161 RepID=A0ACC1R8E1_9HYPO|nr:hypothetical protein NM208_g17088 [Fusarium decemcellulare]
MSSTMDHDMHMTGTATATMDMDHSMTMSMASATSTGMSMGDMEGMGGTACKISVNDVELEHGRLLLHL